MRSFLLRSILVFAVALAVTSVANRAFAQAQPDGGAAITTPAAPTIAAAAPATPVGDPMTIAIVVSAIGLLSALLRRVAPAAHWAHTGVGMFALAVLGAVLGALSQALQVHGFAWSVLLVSAIGAATAAVGAYNPSLGSAVALVLFLGVAVGACGYCNQAANVATARCQLQQDTVDCARLAEADTVTLANAADVVKALISNGANYIADLEAVAAKIGSGGWEFVSCELAALKQQYLKALATPASSPGRSAAPDVIARIDAALAAHPRQVVNAGRMPVLAQ